MELLLDTNALVYAIATKNYRKIDAKCHILDLTFYEYGNAMINIVAKRKSDLGMALSKDEAVVLMQSFRELSKIMPTVNMKSGMMQPILEMAESEKLTFYDASYLYCCLLYKYRLVTDDRRLAKSAANNDVIVIENSTWLAEK